MLNHSVTDSVLKWRVRRGGPKKIIDAPISKNVDRFCDTFPITYHVVLWGFRVGEVKDSSSISMRGRNLRSLKCQIWNRRIERKSKKYNVKDEIPDDILFFYFWNSIPFCQLGSLKFWFMQTVGFAILMMLFLQQYEWLKWKSELYFFALRSRRQSVWRQA